MLRKILLVVAALLLLSTALIGFFYWRDSGGDGPGSKTLRLSAGHV